MPWTKKTYPPSMENLPKAIRDKAVEIANALLDETKMPEGIVIATAISRAKDWGCIMAKKIKTKLSSHDLPIQRSMVKTGMLFLIRKISGLLKQRGESGLKKLLRANNRQ